VGRAESLGREHVSHMSEIPCNVTFCSARKFSAEACSGLSRAHTP
jgi:hypothetical protein